jgi:hypothetical protein
MLLELSYKVGDTVSIKLSSGEELIAKLTEETADKIVLEKPLTLVAQQQGIGLAPFMFTVSPDAKLNINMKNVICMSKTIEEMAKQYTSQTTGIALA